MNKGMRNVVVIGGGAAGANVAKQLDKSLPDTHRVVLIDQRVSVACFFIKFFVSIVLIH